MQILIISNLKNITIILSQFNQEIFQTDNKYTFYLSYKSKKNGNLTWRCVNYNQTINRCQAEIITKENKEIINWESELIIYLIELNSKK